MESGYASLQHKWFDQVWNMGNAEVIDELLHPEVVGYGLVDSAGNEVRGIPAFKDFYYSFRSAFPDINVEIEQLVEQGDFLVVLCRVCATHAGEGFMSAPTGKRVEFTGTCMVRLEDGLIRESWNCFDFLSVMQQLDLLTFNI